MPDDDVLNKIIDRVHSRNEKWHTTLVDALPMPSVIGQTAILGTYSMCLMNSHVRLLLEPPAISVDHCKESPTALARDYLFIEYGHSPKAKHSQIERIKYNIAGPPHYSKPGRFGCGYNIDIKAAYWSMMLAIGWDVDYWPGKWLLPGKPPDSFPFSDHKVARNCLVSAGLIGKVPMWSEERGYFEIFKGNPLANMQLWRVIQDSLNSIASQAIEAGAIYANTDGFIVPDDVSKNRVEAIITDWGLESRVKAAGPGGVFGNGSYQVGTLRAGRHDDTAEQAESFPIEKPHYAKWLQQRFSHFAGRRKK
jgi:hypothetical protein